MEVFSDLSDHPWERGTQQFLHTGRPGIIPAVNFQIVDPLRENTCIIRLPVILLKSEVVQYFKIKNYTEHSIKKLKQTKNPPKSLRTHS